MKKTKLVYKVDFSKKNYGLNKRQLTTLINRSTRSIIASGEKNEIKSAINLALKFQQTGKISKKSLRTLAGSAGYWEANAKNERFIKIAGGRGLKKSFQQTNARFNQKTINKLVNAKILSTKQATNLKTGITQAKINATKQQTNIKDVSDNDFNYINSIVQEMGGLARAIDEYPVRMQQICEKFGIEIDDLPDIFYSR